MASIHHIRGDQIITSNRLKKKLQVKKKVHKIIELENSMHVQSGNILDLVKLNALRYYREQPQLNGEESQVSTSREPLTEQGNASCRMEGRNLAKAYECSSITKQILRKSILDKRREKLLRQMKSKEVCYKPWRPW